MVILPTEGSIDQLTSVFVVPVTEGTKSWVWLMPNMTDEGVIVMPKGGTRVTVAVADRVASAELVAMTVIICGLVTIDGAVYCPPDEMRPTGGDVDHTTAVFVVPVTVAVKFCV